MATGGSPVRSKCVVRERYGTPGESEELEEACGLFGCVASGEWPTNLDVAHIIYLGLIGLQHRGQESAGIAASSGATNNLPIIRGTGLVSHAFREDDLAKLQGNLGIGHTRYSTLGGTEHMNTQPFVVHTKHGLLAVAHNGELVNAAVLRKKILEKGVGLSTGSDSELITQILSMPPETGEPDGPDWPARIRQLMKLTATAYSLLIMFGDAIYAVRDPYGNRPLCIGKLVPPRGPLEETDGEEEGQCCETENGAKNDKSKSFSDQGEASEIDGYVVSSESCSFPSVSGRLIREVQPGEIVKITKTGYTTVGIVGRPNNELPAFCIFEYVYFARPDSYMEGQQVYSVREECGRELARESPVNADIVSSVPESATPAAFGFSKQSGIPYSEVLCKNRYVGRSFIQPTNRLRQLAVLKKFGPLSANFQGKRVVLVDDSIVRGNTIGAIIRLLKGAGAKEVHIRIASPPLHYPCYMGINIPTKEELIANRSNAQELARNLGAASLVYLSVEGLERAVRLNIATDNGMPIGHCTACLTGKYPVKLEW